LKFIKIPVDLPAGVFIVVMGLWLSRKKSKMKNYIKTLFASFTLIVASCAGQPMGNQWGFQEIVPVESPEPLENPMYRKYTVMDVVIPSGNYENEAWIRENPGRQPEVISFSLRSYTCQTANTSLLQETITPIELREDGKYHFNINIETTPEVMECLYNTSLKVNLGIHGWIGGLDDDGFYIILRKPTN